jgi:diaminohydroxyphosphoribosylaminopyrimidine deaminase/5-amino-6-(5-phosphoribosylamino)uracil reductase
VLEQEAQRLNEPFHKAMTRGLPLVIAKVAQSVDGKIATRGGAARWISSVASRRVAHRWRGRVDAVLVGVNTVRQDDPLLTARGVGHRRGKPVKVIVDSRLRTPATARCLSEESPTPAIIATTVHSNVARQRFRRRNVEVITRPARKGRVPLRRLCRWLLRRGIQSVLIEGGGEVLASAFEERIVDRVVLFIAPLLIGGRDAPSALGGVGPRTLRGAIRLTQTHVRRIGPDLCIEAMVEYPRS